MSNFKFIHCSDFHLDARFTATGLSGNKAVLRRKELINSFSIIIDKVLSEEIKILLIAGDLFEHDYVNRETIKLLINEFKRINSTHVFISPGNHDPYVENSYYKLYEWPKSVHVFNSELKRVYIEEHNVVIYGLGFEEKYIHRSKIDEIRDLINKENKLTYKILLTHGTLSRAENKCEYHPILIEEIVSMGFDYVALGHFHQYKLIGDNICYSGSPEPLGFDELGKHGIISGSISDKSLSLNFEDINKREYIINNLNISGFETLKEIENKIDEVLRENKDNFIKIILEGKKDKDLNLNIDILKETFEEKCFYLDIINNTVLEYEIDEIKKEKNLRGVFVKNILNELEKTTDMEKQERLKEALYLGLDALNN